MKLLRSLAAALCLLPSLARADFARPVYSPPNAGQFTNLNSVNLKKWRAALARVNQGTGRAFLAIVGDSTTSGAGAGTSGVTNMVGAMARSYSSQLAKMLNRSIPASFNSFFSDQNAFAAIGQGNYPQFDPRVTFGAGWQQGNPQTLGGNLFLNNTTSNPLTFTPSGQVDTFVAWVILSNTSGSLTAAIDGTSVGTITQSSLGNAGLNKVTYTATKGVHAFSLTPASCGCFVAGVVAYDSTTPAVDVVQFGWYGGKAADQAGATASWSPVNALTKLAPDLTIINLTINDSNNGTSLTSYAANMQTIITNAKQSGDVILMVGAPSGSTQGTNGTLDQFIGVLQSLSASNNVPLINLKARWQSYAAINPVMPYFDTVHPGPLATSDEALFVLQAISSP